MSIARQYGLVSDGPMPKPAKKGAEAPPAAEPGLAAEVARLRAEVARLTLENAELRTRTQDGTPKRTQRTQAVRIPVARTRTQNAARTQSEGDSVRTEPQTRAAKEAARQRARRAKAKAEQP
jgi:imidazolonepropionase-like amidohydrolase